MIKNEDTEKLLNEDNDKALEIIEKRKELEERLKFKNKLKRWKDLPSPTELLGELIIKNHVHFVFGRTGVGKSSLMYYISLAIATGKDTFDNEKLYNKSGPLKVLYLDFELTDEVINDRYKAAIDDIPDNFYHIDTSDIYEDGHTEINDKVLRYYSEQLEPDVIIVDNLVAITGNNDSSKNDDAKKIMTALFAMARQKGNRKTIIILNHTPKIADFKEFEINDMKGGSTFNQLSDGVLAIGRVMGNNKQIYIKHLKGRKGLYGPDDKVYHFEMSGDKHNWGFEFLGREDEKKLITHGIKFSATDEVKQVLGDKKLTHTKFKDLLIEKLKISENAAKQRIKNSTGSGVSKGPDGLYYVSE